MENDTEYYETEIISVEGENGAWFVQQSDGWSFFFESPIEPKVGMKAKVYSSGVGSVIRGLVLDGQVIFYRSAEEERIRRKKEIEEIRRSYKEKYGEDLLGG